MKVVKRELTLDSREVAEMVGKRHSDLLRDIETYISYISQNANLRYEVLHSKAIKEVLKWPIVSAYHP